MWWRQAVTAMPRTLEECDQRLRENIGEATIVQDGVVLVENGVVVNKKLWDDRVKRIFDRREKYQQRRIGGIGIAK